MPAAPDGFEADLGLPRVPAQLLYNRGVRTSTDAAQFVSTDSSLSHDPALLPDMDRAVARLVEAIGAREVIGVFGDFDTDGVTGTAVLVRALRGLGRRGGAAHTPPGGRGPRAERRRRRRSSRPRRHAAHHRGLRCNFARRDPDRHDHGHRHHSHGPPRAARGDSRGSRPHQPQARGLSIPVHRPHGGWPGVQAGTGAVYGAWQGRSRRSAGAGGASERWRTSGR